MTGHVAAVWALHSRRSINKLESVQKHVARFVMNDYFQTSSVSNNLLKKEHKYDRSSL